MPRPGPDRRPRRFAGPQLALVDEPAADRRYGSPLWPANATRTVCSAAVGLGDAQPARALHLQHQRVQRVGHVGDLAPAQRGLRRRQRCRAAAASNRACGSPGRPAARAAARESAPRRARGFDQRLEVAGRQAFDRAVVRLHAIRQQPLHRARFARRGIVGRRSRAARRRTASAQPGGGRSQPRCRAGHSSRGRSRVPAGQVATMSRRPSASARARPRRSAAARCGGAPARRCRHGGRRAWRRRRLRQRRTGAGDERRYDRRNRRATTTACG